MDYVYHPFLLDFEPSGTKDELNKFQNSSYAKWSESSCWYLKSAGVISLREWLISRGDIDTRKQIEQCKMVVVNQPLASVKSLGFSMTP